MKQRFEEIFEKRNPKYKYLLRYMRAAFGVDEVTFEDINTSNLLDFKEYMYGEVSNNSLKTYFAIITSTCRAMADDGLIKSAKCLSALKVKKTPQQNVALTESEVQRIYDYYERIYSNDKHQAEKDVLTLFLIECYCGARGCDVEDFTENNIQDGMLSYVSKKTKTLAVMPAHKYLLKLIHRIPKVKYGRPTKNRTIKRVCEKVGIVEPVTIFYHGKMRTHPKSSYVGFHTARRSFASILAAKRVAVSEISQYMSHNSTLMTDRYIKVDTRNASVAAMEFFNG